MAVILVKKIKRNKINKFKCFNCGEELGIHLNGVPDMMEGCCEEHNAERQYWKIL
ncbi:MAG: hypothetical protein ACOCTT_01290 [archaeon]